MNDDTKSPTKMSKTELKNALFTAGYTADQLIAMKKPELLEKLQAHHEGNKDLAVLSSVEEDDEVGVAIGSDTEASQDDTCESEPEPEELDPPTPNDPEWTQYVLGQFLEDEVDGKNPRVEGLRRVAGLLVGELIEEGCDLIAAPSEDNRFRACTKAWGIFVLNNGITKRFEALADAHDGNCMEDYATYLVAMADTRAKGRMFRNALCLRKVVAAEEVSKTMASAADIQAGGSIHTGQVSLIRMISDRNNFSITEVLDGLDIKYELNENTGDVNLQKLSYEEALATATKMGEMARQKEKVR